MGLNQGGDPPNEIIDTARPVECDVQALDIFAAVREVWLLFDFMFMKLLTNSQKSYVIA